ncbi:Uncharacterised protein [Candidatus Norongarragalina meridionalis]|nr:Uncharacterised protein [Candidatus Norongarragalina meridionalis]
MAKRGYLARSHSLTGYEGRMIETPVFAPLDNLLGKNAKKLTWRSIFRRKALKERIAEDGEKLSRLRIEEKRELLEHMLRTSGKVMSEADVKRIANEIAGSPQRFRDVFTSKEFVDAIYKKAAFGPLKLRGGYVPTTERILKIDPHDVVGALWARMMPASRIRTTQQDEPRLFPEEGGGQAEGAEGKPTAMGGGGGFAGGNVTTKGRYNFVGANIEGGVRIFEGIKPSDLQTIFAAFAHSQQVAAGAATVQQTQTEASRLIRKGKAPKTKLPPGYLEYRASVIRQQRKAQPTVAGTSLVPVAQAPKPKYPDLLRFLGMKAPTSAVYPEYAQMVSELRELYGYKPGDIVPLPDAVRASMGLPPLGTGTKGIPMTTADEIRRAMRFDDVRRKKAMNRDTIFGMLPMFGRAPGGSFMSGAVREDRGRPTTAENAEAAEYAEKLAARLGKKPPVEGGVLELDRARKASGRGLQMEDLVTLGSATGDPRKLRAIIGSETSTPEMKGAAERALASLEKQRIREETTRRITDDIAIREIDAILGSERPITDADIKRISEMGNNPALTDRMRAHALEIAMKLARRRVINARMKETYG